MPGYWLLKSEPGEYSFEDLQREKRAVWDGVRNFKALGNMRRVRRGDSAFFYHTGKEKAIVGVARIETAAYPDPGVEDERIVVFDIRPARRLPKPVSLSQIKSSKGFEDWELVRLPRLSVMPVPKRLWDRILKMSSE